MADYRYQLTDEMSTPEDITKLKLLKESEPLQNAWDEWRKTRQVRFHAKTQKPHSTCHNSFVVQ